MVVGRADGGRASQRTMACCMAAMVRIRRTIERCQGRQALPRRRPTHRLRQQPLQLQLHVLLCVRTLRRRPRSISQPPRRGQTVQCAEDLPCDRPATRSCSEQQPQDAAAAGRCGAEMLQGTAQKRHLPGRRMLPLLLQSIPGPSDRISRCSISRSSSMSSTWPSS